MSDERSNEPVVGGPRRRSGGLRLAWGLVLIAVGTWFFLERTLGIDLPSIPWRDLWPVLLIALGLWIVLSGGLRRRT